MERNDCAEYIRGIIEEVSERKNFEEDSFIEEEGYIIEGMLDIATRYGLMDGEEASELYDAAFDMQCI